MNFFSSSSLVLCLSAGPLQPTPPLFSILRPPLHTNIRSLHEAVNHPNPWSAPRSLILHSSFSTSFNNPSPLTTCPIQFFFCLTIVSTILLLSTTASSTSSLLILSSQLTFSNLLQNHISNASNLSITSFFMTQVSHPYSTTGHTRTLTNLFLSTLFILLESSSFRLLNASFAHPIRCFISSIHLPSSAITDPRYLNVLTCSTLCPSIMILTVPQSFFETTIVLVFLILIFILYFLATAFNLSINLCNPISVLATIP